MKIIKWSLIAVVALAMLIAAIGLALPSTYRVVRAAEIKAPAAKVYALIQDPREWARWTVWNQRDPAMKMSYAGAARGQGAKWSWESRTEGNGSMEFTRAEADRMIGYRLSFPDFGMTSNGLLVLEESQAGTRITWSNEGAFGANPYMHYFALLMERMVGPDFEQGLARLKQVAESR